MIRIIIVSACLTTGLFISSCSSIQSSPPRAQSLPATLTPAPISSATATRVATLTPIPTATSTLIPIAAPTSVFPRISAEQEEKNIAAAIVIEASSESEGIAKEREWLERNFPSFQKLGQKVSFNRGKVYDLIAIATANNENKIIYFDITAFYGKP